MPRGGKRAGAGRPKGSLGAMTEKVLDLLDELDFDPLLELITLYRDPQTDRRTKVRIASELAQFVAPKLKAIDVQAAGSQGITINLVEYRPQAHIIKIDEQSPKCFSRQKAITLSESSED